jgi:hypothetical protein
VKFLNHLDLTKNEIRNARVQNLATAPSDPVAGQIYFDTVLGYLRVYDGSGWARLDDNWLASVSGTAPIGATTSDGAVTVSISAATTEAAGSMSSTDKTLLDGATATDTASTLVKRDASKRFRAADPSDAQDVATKAYVDGVASGLDVKQSVRVGTTANITLSGEQTIDGVSVVTGDRVLVKDQSAGENNGIYVAASGSWSRSSDADSNVKVTPNLFVFVEEGTANADSGFTLTNNGSIVLGTTELVFTQFSGAGMVIAGDGLTKDGNTLNVVGTTDRISVGSDSVDISTAYVGQTSITTLGTVTTGTWSATDVAVEHGGTGSSTAAGARTNLGAVGKYAVDIGNNSATSITVTHNLNSRDVTVMVREVGSPYAQVFPDIEMTTVDTITVNFTVAPTNNQYRVIVTG